MDTYEIEIGNNRINRETLMIRRYEFGNFLDLRCEVTTNKQD